MESSNDCLRVVHCLLFSASLVSGRGVGHTHHIFDWLLAVRALALQLLTTFVAHNEVHAWLKERVTGSLTTQEAHIVLFIQLQREGKRDRGAQCYCFEFVMLALQRPWSIPTIENTVKTVES